jgi:hypothetical protein
VKNVIAITLPADLVTTASTETYAPLARLKTQLGNKNGAGQAQGTALKLAHDYKPAQGLTF